MKIEHVHNVKINVGIKVDTPVGERREFANGTFLNAHRITCELRRFGKTPGTYYVAWDVKDRIIAFLPANECYVRYSYED